MTPDTANVRTGWKGITFGTITFTREEWTRATIVAATLFGFTLGRML